MAKCAHWGNKADWGNKLGNNEYPANMVVRVISSHTLELGEVFESSQVSAKANHLKGEENYFPVIGVLVGATLGFGL